MDIIAKAAEALQELTAEGYRVQQGWYDANIRELHITLWDLGTAPAGHSDDAEEVETGNIQINIWSDKDQVELKQRIKKLMCAAGFMFAGSNDDLETNTKIFANAARFTLTEEREDEENECS